MEAFEVMKRVLASDTVIQIYRKNKETKVHTDASKDGYGGILVQRDEQDGEWHLVYYMSGEPILQLRAGGARYSIYGKISSVLIRHYR